MTLSPLPERLKKVLSTLETILLTIIFYPFYLMGLGFEKLENRAFPQECHWYPWFAWYPVRLGWGWEQDLVWLEKVDRARYCGYVMHRRRGDTQMRGPWSMMDGE